MCSSSLKLCLKGCGSMPHQKSYPKAVSSSDHLPLTCHSQCVSAGLMQTCLLNKGHSQLPCLPCAASCSNAHQDSLEDINQRAAQFASTFCTQHKLKMVPSPGVGL